jgi:TolB protein
MFQTMPEAGMQRKPNHIANVDFNYWRHSDRDYLVIGYINNMGDDKYQVTFALLNVVLGSQNQGDSPVIISKRFVVKSSEMRPLAHRIADIIYHQITGIKGIFSTQLAYVWVSQEAQQSLLYHLEVADVDGYNPRTLVTSQAPLMSPAWSPDGQRIAYVSLAHQQASINVVSVASGKQQKITDFKGINGAPAWSPDGQTLALVLSKTGHPKIYLYSLDEQKLKQLTFGMAIDTEPNWSPDGKAIYFTSNRGGGPQIYRYRLKNANIERVTFQGHYNARPQITPDGLHLVMLHKNAQGYNITIENLASGGLHILTTDGYNSSPSVAPNGQMIIYANNETKQGYLGMVSKTGKVKLKLPSPKGRVLEPAWSPFLNN